MSSYYYKAQNGSAPQSANSSSARNQLDLDVFLGLLWKRISLIIVSGVVCAALLFGYAKTAVSPQYEASVLFFVNTSSYSIGNALHVNASNGTKVGNYLNILKSRSNLELVIEKSGASISYKQLRNMINAAAVPDTDMIQLTVTTGNPESARLLANAIADILPEKVAEITASTSLEVVDYAETPEARVSPNYTRFAGIGFFAGVALCGLVIFAIAWFDDVVRNRDYLEQTYTIPVVAEIPDLGEKGGRYGYYSGGYGSKQPSPHSGGRGKGKNGAAKEKLSRREAAMLCDGLSFAAAEAYKLLRTNLLFALPEKRCRVLGITSSMRGEGKTTTAINLSYSFAQAGKRVLLIDADMRLPTVHEKLKINKTPGLSNLLVGMNQVSDCLIKSELYAKWCLVPAGDAPPNPLELLGSDQMHQLLEHFEEHFDYIILDLPPVNIVADGLVASKWTDGLLTVVRRNYTERKALRLNISQVESIGVKELGFVLTYSSEGGFRYKNYGKYGKYGYGKPKDKKERLQHKEEEEKALAFMDVVTENSSAPDLNMKSDSDSAP